MLPWSHAEERLERAEIYWLATVRPDGRPHVTPIWGVWVGGALYFDGLFNTRWARNIAANPQVAVHLESGVDVVIVEGQVDDLTTDPELGAQVVAAWDAKYGMLHPEPATRGIFRLRPTTARAWSDPSTFADATHWDFSSR
jgi:nitroimidazol reductase NimA-like FMN-containing flavoprotein (pyridoxamine 5'-phosphate oxidase superfamily)